MQAKEKGGSYSFEILEFDTKRAGEVESLMNEWWTQAKGKHYVKREVVAKHRDRPDHYVAIVEFSSYDEAQNNSKPPETDRFNAHMAKLSRARSSSPTTM